MKKSNIISIAFGLFLIGGTFALYVDSTLHRDVGDQGMAIYKKVLLPPFSVILAEKGSDLHIEQSDINQLTIEHDPENKIPSDLYRIAHDTLHISKGFTVFVKGKNIRTIIGPKHYYLGIYEFNSDSLNQRMKAERFYRDSLYSGFKECKDRMYRCGIYSKDSAYLEINKTDLYHITLKADQAVVSLKNSQNAFTYNNEGIKYKNGSTDTKYNFSSEIKKIEKDSTAWVKVSTW